MKSQLPRICELEGLPRKCKPVILKGGYKDILSYADTYRDLTREDFASQVRRGVKQYKRDWRIPPEKRPRNFELDIADEIKFGHQVVEHTGLSWQVFFDPNKFKGRKQLIPNAMVLFGVDGRIEATGIVACSGEFCEIELENDGMVHIAISEGFLDVDCNRNYQMLVATDYFAPYKCVLPRLSYEVWCPYNYP